MLKTILVILTLGDTGATHIAFTQTETMEECTARAAAVSQILTEAGTQIEAVRCGESALAFTPYGEVADKSDRRWTYEVTLSGSQVADGFTLRQVAAGSCETDGSTKQYCAISAQAPVEH